jgi:hypothetical protein
MAEFVPVGGGAPLRSPRETTQPNRHDALYWATGLSKAYLEGAYDRALKPIVQHRSAPSEPMFHEPAAAIVRTVDAPVTESVLDPFSVYEKGEGLLRQELSALRAWHLANIVVAYRLSDDPVSTLNELSAESLIEIIVGAVRERTFARR